ncbi:MAG: DUF4465 domain-containing protein [Bacteroidales bacterium]
MKLFYFSLSGLFLTALTLTGQPYLIPHAGLKVAYFSPELKPVRAFEVNQRYFYYNDGDTIYQVDPFLGGVSMKYGKPAGYGAEAIPTFLNISPDGTSLWAGFTDPSNVDARIYQVNVATGAWEQKAMMPSNLDLAFWNDLILVSGLNSADLMTPNGIFILDTTGSDQHRKIVDVGGSMAGMAVDMQGNLCFGTSSSSDPNALYRISSADLSTVIETPAAAPLQLSNAQLLSDLPMGVYDCEVDVGGNLLFTMNLPGGTNVLGQWNGSPGAGPNYDTLAVSSEWLGMIKSRGDYSSAYLGNSLFTLGYGQAVADLHTIDYPPRVIAPLPVITGYESALLGPIDLSHYMTDLDDPGGISFQVNMISDESVAELTLTNDTLSGIFGKAGQANLVIEATSGGLTVSVNTLVGTWPQIQGNYLVSDFEDLTLDPESYWNGSDGSGSFSTGPARFHNDFNMDYFSWSGWAHSNTSDRTTTGYMNQYSAITGAGFASGEALRGIYGISSMYGPVVIDFPEKAYAPEGFFVTNSTYTTLSMEQGDWLAKQFGGTDGTDPDFLKLMIWGFDHSASTDTLEYYLADFRFEEPGKDYMIKTWQWVDLSSFGKVDSLMFGLESSDQGEWGMNTPAYFCMDNLCLNPDAAPYVANPVADLVIYSDGTDTVIDISSVFSDPDDDDLLMVKRIISGSHEGPLMASVSGDSLILQGTCWLVKSSFIDLELVLEGSLGGLSATDTFLVHVECVGGTGENNHPEAELYPNPGSGAYILDFSTGEPLDVFVYSSTGSEVWAQPDFLPGGVIDLTGQPSGPYIVRISYSGGVISKLIQKL